MRRHSVGSGQLCPSEKRSRGFAIDLRRPGHWLLLVSAIFTILVGESIAPDSPTVSDTFVQGAGGESTGTGTGFAGDGFIARVEGLKLGSDYVFRPVSDNKDYTSLLAPTDTLASELESLTGLGFSRGSPLSGHTSTSGEISIGVLTPFPVPGCDLTVFIGCGGLAIVSDSNGIATVDHGWVSLAPEALDNPRILRAVLGHEVGHTLGMAHFDENFNGGVQLMHTMLVDPTLETYRDGDIRGIRYVAANGLGDPSLLPPLVPASPSSLTIEELGEAVKLGWKVADNGSDLVEHEVALEITTTSGATTAVHKAGPSRGVTITGLEPGVKVRYKVRASNADGFGPWSPFSLSVTILCKGPFDDVPSGHLFCPDIKWAALNSIAEGYGDGTFKPTRSVGRQEMAAFLRRTVELVAPGTTNGTWPTNGFPDVQPTNQFSDDIDWLAATGITGGFDDGTFRPEAPVSRQEMAAFLRRTVELVLP